MTWTYYRSSGELWHKGVILGKGDSGNLTNKNNPDRQHVRGMGLLPRGMSQSVGHSMSKGPMKIILKMTSGESFGRSEFRFHGERKSPKPPGCTSSGCIIIGPHVRSKIILSSDRTLEVVR